MNILIVDDEAAARKNLINVLESVTPQAEITAVGNAALAMEKISEKSFDIAFLDIEMPGKNGLELAEEIKRSSPLTNIVMVTAYDHYAIDAFRLFVSGYILKPATEDEVEKALKNLRRPVNLVPKGLYLQCFGNFEVFYNGRIVRFRRRRAKEMLAYLVDRRGAGVTGEELRAILWEDEAEDTEKQRDYMQKIWHNLRDTLKDLGCEDAVNHSRNLYAVNVDKVRCDYYEALERSGGHMGPYPGEYMNQYSWAEFSEIRSE